MWKLLIAPVALGWLLITPVASQPSRHSSHNMPAPQAAVDFSRLMSTAMDKMHEEMAAPSQTGDPDRDFLAMMIPHHAGAVEMARLILIYGRDPLVRQLAEGIIAGQQAEIGAMQARLKVLNQGPDPRPGGFPAISGTRGE
jgi:uncharacterized protein (DUF305 family)